MANGSKKLREDLNEKSYEHTSHYGCKFTATRCDFRDGVKVTVPRHLSEEQIFVDVSEFVSYHVLNIFERLNGFQGYDCIQYQITRK